FQGDAAPGLQGSEEEEQRQVGLRAPRSQQQLAADLAGDLPDPGNGGPGSRRGGAGTPRRIRLSQFRGFGVEAPPAGFGGGRGDQEGGCSGGGDVPCPCRPRDAQLGIRVRSGFGLWRRLKLLLCGRGRDIRCSRVDRRVGGRSSNPSPGLYRGSRGELF
ncbi:unnamed protein product, partial [Linum tenue]